MTDLPDVQKVRLPGAGSEINARINGLLTELHTRRRANLVRQSYYDSKRSIKTVGTLIPPQYFRLGLSLGWTAKAVDALTGRANLEGFVWPEAALADIGGTEVLDENHLLSEVDGALNAALIHGPAFLINTVGEADEPRSLIHVKDATEATGSWNRRRRGLDDLISVTERDKEGAPLSLALYLPGRTIVAQRASRGQAWTVDDQEHIYGMPVEVLPYRPLPNRPFGRSRITQPIMGLQDAALRSLIRLEGHMDVYSYPELWLLGADLSIFKNADGTQMDAWQIRLGRIRGVPDDEDATQPRADVKQISASSPEPNLAGLNAIAKMFAREASLPDTAVAITDVSNPTSAESYDASQYELIAEAETVIRDASPALRKSFIRSLAIKNGVAASKIPTEWKSIDTKWRNPRYLSKAAEADAGSKQVAAAPWLAETEVGLELIGLTEQQITRALAERRRLRGREALDAIAASVNPAPAAPSDDVA